MTMASQLHWCWYPTATRTPPSKQLTTKGARATSLISGSLIPLFRRVRNPETQSLNGPAKASDSATPTRAPKFVYPTFAADMFQGGPAKACDCVTLMITSIDAAQAKEKLDHKTIGNENRRNGMMRAGMMPLALALSNFPNSEN